MGDVVRMDLKNEGIGEPTVYPQEGTKFDSETLDNAFKLFKTMYFRGRNVEDLDHVMVELDSGSEQSVHSQEGIKHEYEELKTAFKRQFLMTERDSLYQRLGDLLAKEKGLWEAPDLPDLYEMKMLQRQLGYTSMRLNEIHTELQVLEMEQGAKSFKEGQRQNDADKKRESIKRRRLGTKVAVKKAAPKAADEKAAPKAADKKAAPKATDKGNRMPEVALKMFTKFPNQGKVITQFQVVIGQRRDKISVTLSYEEGDDADVIINLSELKEYTNVGEAFEALKKFFKDQPASYKVTVSGDGNSFTATKLQ